MQSNPMILKSLPEKISVYTLAMALAFLIIALLLHKQMITSSLVNLALLKDIDPMNPNMGLYYPLGNCEDIELPQTLAPNAMPDYFERASPYLAGISALHHGNSILAARFFEKAIANNNTPSLSFYGMGYVQLLFDTDPTPYWSHHNSVDRLIQVGKECLVYGSSEQATRYYTIALQALMAQNHPDSKHIGTLVEYFASIDREEDFSEALALYLTIADPSLFEYHRVLGRAYSSRQETDLALTHFWAAAELRPDDSSIWYEIGRTHVQAQQYQDGREALSRAIEISPDFSAYYVWMGHSFFYQRRHEEAGFWYEEALKRNPKDRKAVESLVRVRMNQEDYQSAYELAVQLIDLDNRPFVYALASEAALNQGNWEQSLRHIDSALQLEPDNLRYNQQLAHICETISDKDCMIRAYESMLRLAPTDISLQQKLKQIMEETP